SRAPRMSATIRTFSMTPPPQPAESDPTPFPMQAAHGWKTGARLCHQGAMRDSWTSGYTQSELDFAQERYGLTFPPDLVALLLNRRPADGWDWRTDDEGIRRALAHPLSGLLFDVEHGLWWPEWGERPEPPAERAEIVTAIVAAAPA